MYTINSQASIATLLAAYNEVAPKSRKSFKSKDEAIAKLTDLGLDVVANTTLADQVLTEAPRATPGPKTDLTMATINTTAAANPARPRTARHARFAILSTLNGKTVADYYKACREAGIPCSKNNPILAMQKGFITLTLSDGTEVTCHSDHEFNVA